MKDRYSKLDKSINTDKSKGDNCKVGSKPDNYKVDKNIYTSSSNIDDNIASTKLLIQNIKNTLENNLDSSLRDIQIDLKIGCEKIELLEKRNQNIKIFLTNTPVTVLGQEEIDKIDNEIKKIQIMNIENIKKHFEKLEDEYNNILFNFKEAQEEMNLSKKKLGDNYHNEMDLKNKHEDLEEKIVEYGEAFKRNNMKIKRVISELGELRQLMSIYDCEIVCKNGDDDGNYNNNQPKTIDNNQPKTINNDKPKTIDNDKPKTINNDKPKTIDNLIYMNSNPTSITNNNKSILTLDLSSQDLKDVIKKSEKILSQFVPKEILPGIFEEYNTVLKSYEKAKDEYEQISNILKVKRSKIEDLKTKRYEEFMEGFKNVSKYLKEIYKTLTYGGNAELELVDYLDPFSEGIVLAVMPPKKCWKNVSNLSGGEKTLSSLSLIFALHKYKPSPFYLMDEIDAALDYRNVSIISNYIKEMTKDSQFIVISLRSDMFEMSRKMLGVYKTKNVSKFLMVDVNEYIV